MPNFIEIGQTSLEIGVGRKEKFTHTYIHTYRHTHGILTIWVALRSARGATKNAWQSLAFSAPGLAVSSPIADSSETNPLVDRCSAQQCRPPANVVKLTHSNDATPAVYILKYRKFRVYYTDSHQISTHLKDIIVIWSSEIEIATFQFI